MMLSRTAALIGAVIALGGCMARNGGGAGTMQSSMAQDSAMESRTMPMMMAHGRDAPMSMMSMAGMMDDHIEGRLAFFKAELQITDAQMPQWNAFADAMRANAKRMAEMHHTMTQGGTMHAMSASTPERLDRMEMMMSAHLESLRTAKAAFRPLYAVLSDEQKKKADALLMGPPMGMM